MRYSLAFPLALVSIEARRRSARCFSAGVCLRSLTLRSARDGVAVVSSLGLVFGEIDQDLGLLGRHDLEPADGLADREQPSSKASDTSAGLSRSVPGNPL